MRRYLTVLAPNNSCYPVQDDLACVPFYIRFTWMGSLILAYLPRTCVIQYNELLESVGNKIQILLYTFCVEPLNRFV